MDNRDKPTWVVVEINHLAEEKIYDERFLPIVRRALKVDEEYQIFTPWELVKNSRAIELVEVMEGYFFVQAGLAEHVYFNLERLDFVEQVLCSPNSSSIRVVQVIDNNSVDELKHKLKKMLTCDLKVGERVFVSEGNLRNLEGEVLDILDEDQALIYFEFRSLKVATAMPKYFLKRLDKEGSDE